MGLAPRRARAARRLANRSALQALATSSLIVLLVAVFVTGPSARITPKQVAHAACADVLFLGAMGSGQRTVWEETDGYGWEVNNLRRALARQLTSSGISMADAPIDYPARGTDILKPGLADINLKRYSDRVASYFAGLSNGVDEVTNRLVQTASRCRQTNQLVVLAGYSQGAMVMHRALLRLRDQGRRDILNRVTGVVLFADGDRASNSAVSRLIGDPAAGRKGQGISQAFGSQPDIPAAVAGRTWNFCTKNDLVCDFRGTWNLNKNNSKLAAAIHGSYRGKRYAQTPAWHIADDIEGRLRPSATSTPTPSATPTTTPPPTGSACDATDERPRRSDAPSWVGDIRLSEPYSNGADFPYLRDIYGTFRNNAPSATRIWVLTAHWWPGTPFCNYATSLRMTGAGWSPTGGGTTVNDFILTVNPLSSVTEIRCVVLVATSGERDSWTSDDGHSDFSPTRCIDGSGALQPSRAFNWEAAWQTIIDAGYP